MEVESGGVAPELGADQLTDVSGADVAAGRLLELLGYVHQLLELCGVQLSLQLSHLLGPALARSAALLSYEDLVPVARGQERRDGRGLGDLLPRLALSLHAGYYVILLLRELGSALRPLGLLHLQRRLRGLQIGVGW